MPGSHTPKNACYLPQQSVDLQLTMFPVRGMFPGSIAQKSTPGCLIVLLRNLRTPSKQQELVFTSFMFLVKYRSCDIYGKGQSCSFKILFVYIFCYKLSDGGKEMWESDSLKIISSPFIHQFNQPPSVTIQGYFKKIILPSFLPMFALYPTIHIDAKVIFLGKKESYLVIPLLKTLQWLPIASSCSCRGPQCVI